MSKTVFTVTINGRVEKRTSHRPYTHAVLILRDGSKRKVAVESPFTEKERADLHKEWLASIFVYANRKWVPHSDPAWAVDGWLQCPDHIDRRWSNPGPLTIKKDSLAKYEEKIAAGYEAWVASEHARRLRDFHKDAKKGFFLWHVMQWSMSKKNADAGLRKYLGQSWLPVITTGRVVEVGTTIVLPGDYLED